MGKVLLLAAMAMVAARPDGAGASRPPSAGSPSATTPSDLPPPLPDLRGPDRGSSGPGARGPSEGERSGARGKDQEKGEGPHPEITLGAKDDTITPRRRGAGMAEEGKIVVKARSNRLRATLTGAAFAHCYLGRHAEGVLALRLAQEFEVAPPDRDDPHVSLTLSGTLDGYLRGEDHGTACLRAADAAVYPACGGDPVLALEFPTACGTSRARGDFATPARLLPAGRYVLVANLTPSAAVAGICRGHAEAVFTPGARIGTWGRSTNPFADLDGKTFGLVVEVRAEAP